VTASQLETCIPTHRAIATNSISVGMGQKPIHRIEEREHNGSACPRRRRIRRHWDWRCLSHPRPSRNATPKDSGGYCADPPPVFAALIESGVTGFCAKYEKITAMCVAVTARRRPSSQVETELGTTGYVGGRLRHLDPPWDLTDADRLNRGPDGAQSDVHV